MLYAKRFFGQTLRIDGREKNTTCEEWLCLFMYLKENYSGAVQEDFALHWAPLPQGANAGPVHSARCLNSTSSDATVPMKSGDRPQQDFSDTSTWDTS